MLPDVGVPLAREARASILKPMSEDSPLSVSALAAALFLACAPAPGAQQGEKVAYDEARDGDLGPAKHDGTAAVRVAELGVHVVRGAGADAKDDVDAFVFEVAAGTAFDFCLVGDAAEFKKLRSIGADGVVKEVAFASTNLAFRAPRNIEAAGLPPGRYHVELMFGPNGASGPWVAKIAPRDGATPVEGLCRDAAGPETAERMRQVDWPGAISIFHGHNWGKDEKYPVAIKEAGFGAAGAHEGQIDECRRHGLRAFVFIWPHEADTIPRRHRDDETVLCYYLSDRIPPQQWGAWAAFENTAFAADPRHPAIFTMNADWGAFDRFCPIVRGRAMEYYHYDWDAKRKPHLRYAHLEQARAASIRHGDVPVCRIVETRPEDMRKTRHTVYTSLAYGVRGFRMGGHGIFDPKNRDERGVPARTAYGEEIRRLNAAISAYSPVFREARCEAVYHAAPLPTGGAAAPASSPVALEGEETLVGLFRRRDGDAPYYLLVANRDAFHPRTARLTIAGTGIHVQRMDKASAQWVDHPGAALPDAIRTRVDLEDGGGELLKVARR